MKSMKLTLMGLLLVLSFVFTSCASRTAGWLKSNDAITLTKKERKNLTSKAISHWNLRHIKADLEKSLNAYKTLAKATKDNYKYLTRLARGYYFLADAHYTDIDMKKKYWELGTSFGEKAMATNSAFAKAMKDDGKVEKHLDTLGKKEIGAMYWTAANLGKWAKNSGIATTLKYKNRIKSLVSAVEKLNPKFFYAAPIRYWGAYYAVAPGFAGGSMPKSKINFKKAIKMAPEYLGTKVLYAQFYMTKKEDKKGFKKLLHEVIKAKNKKRMLYSENFIEKLKAKKMLENMDDLF